MNPTALVLNGSIPYRGFDIDGLFYPVEAISQLIPLSIHDLEPESFKEFLLSDFIDTDLMIVSFRADIASDDRATPQETTSRIATTIDLKIIEQEEIIEHITLYISSYPAVLINPLILSKNQTYRISVSTLINSLSFFCKPVYLLPKIKILTANKPYNESTNNS